MPDPTACATCGHDEERHTFVPLRVCMKPADDHTSVDWFCPCTAYVPPAPTTDRPGQPGKSREDGAGLTGHQGYESSRTPVPPTAPHVFPISDAATEAAAEALCSYGGTDFASVAVAAARPIIEAEVRERIAAEIEAYADRLYHGADSPVLAAGCLSAARIARGAS
jgi:hypothetical protein